MDEQDPMEDVPDPSRYAVLIVDDEATFRLSLAEGLSLLRGDKYKPVCVGSVDQAMARLREGKFAALVTDIRMPGKDGLQLLLEMKRQSIRVPTLVTTAYGSPAVHAQAARSGAVRYIEKPFPLEHLIDFLDAATSDEGIGRARSLDLIEVVEMLCMGGKDMRVGIRTRDIQGSIYIHGGEIVHAATQDRAGVEVLLELLSLPQPQISTAPGEEAPEITIDQPWRDLTEEAWRRRTLGVPKSVSAPGEETIAGPDVAASLPEPLTEPRPESASMEIRPVVRAPEPEPQVSEQWFWADAASDVVDRMSTLLSPVRPPEVVALDSGQAVSILHAIAVGQHAGRALTAGLLLGCVLKVRGGAQVFVPTDGLHAVRAACHGPALPERRLYSLARELRPSWRAEMSRWRTYASSRDHQSGGAHGTL